MFERESSLCFNSVDFEREGFDADSFVSNHGRLMDLDSLLGDLRSYHNKIKQSLIEVINCDYEHFVGLSKTLSGLQPVIERVDSPLGQWHSKLQKVRAEVAQVCVTPQVTGSQRWIKFAYSFLSFCCSWTRSFSKDLFIILMELRWNNNNWIIWSRAACKNGKWSCDSKRYHSPHNFVAFFA